MFDECVCAVALVAGAECYTGARLLQQFGFPFEVDMRIMQQAYPWLRDYVQPGCPPHAAGHPGEAAEADNAAAEPVVTE